MDFNFNIIKKSRGEAAKCAPYVVELYEKQDGKTVQIEDALKRLSEDAALINGNKNSHKILLCSETDPYPADYECYTITRGAIKILDENGLDYVIFTENAMRAVSDFPQLKHPKNITLIIKIESIQHDKNYEKQIDEDFVNLLNEAIGKASEKGVRTGIHFVSGSDPMLSLQLVYGLYSDVDVWEVDNHIYEPSTVVRSKWKRFKEDAKDKDFFKTLGPPKSLNKYKINTISDDSRLLLIAPHGVATIPKDDINTDKLTLKIAEKLKCSAIVNDRISRLYLDFNKVDEAEKHNEFILAIKKVLENPGPTLVVWIHGVDDNNLKTEVQKSADVQCLIGYGQGQLNRPTAEKKTVDDMIGLFKDNSIIAHVARDGSNYCGYNTSLMNQWIRSKEYNLPNVQSIQLEFKKHGIRDSKSLDKASHNIAKALSGLVGFKYHVKQQHSETVESEQSGEEIPEQSKTESSDNLPSIIEKETEDPIVSKAFDHLKGIFKRYFHEAMLEAGKYLIDIFYERNPNIAFAKNKTKEQPKSLKKLIKKIQQTSNNPSENVPSTGWVYNAVNLAAHEMICKQEGFQTFGILGHSHKLQLLHVPKLKKVDKDKFNEAIMPAFQEKERLASVAIEKKLSVRDFKAYIKEQHPEDSGTIDLTDLPPLEELRQRESKELSRLRNLAKRKIDGCQKKIDEYQKMIASYNDALNTLSDVLSEKEAAQTGEMSLPKKRSKYQDWVYKTVSCCNGCSNNCLYCFSKGYAINKKRMNLYEWREGKVRPHNMDIEYKRFDNPVMFPGTHDITTDNFDACFTVLKKLLAAKNRVLIVSKPRLDLITKISDDLIEHKNNMLFRFTIGSTNNEILSFWEPNAPLYEERKQCLEYAFKAGYRTSVSVEPMLDSENIEELVNDLSPYVNYSIWIGTMNHIWYMDTDESAAKTEAGILRARQNTEYYGEETAKKIREATKKILEGQSTENLKKIYEKLKDNTLVKWKWHIKKAVGLPQPDTPEEWPTD